MKISVSAWKRIGWSSLAVLCYAILVCVAYHVKIGRDERAFMRSRIEQLLQKPEVKTADERVKAAERRLQMYCAKQSVRCTGDGRAFVIDEPTGRPFRDSETYPYLQLKVLDAKEERDIIYLDIDALTKKVTASADSVQLQLPGIVTAFFLGIGALFGAVDGLVRKKERKVDEGDDAIKITIVELTQDEQDRRRLAELREEAQAIEARLAPRNYREPDRTVEPVQAIPSLRAVVDQAFAQQRIEEQEVSGHDNAKYLELAKDDIVELAERVEIERGV